MAFKKKQNFISIFPHGLFVEALLKSKPVKQAFCRGEEGDFVLHLLADNDLTELHLAEPNSQALITLHLKLDLLRQFSWEEFKEHFAGEAIETRLKRTANWLEQSFGLHKKRKSHARYLRDLPTFDRLKKRLSKVKLHGEDFFHALASFRPGQFDLIYLGRLLDEPEFLHHETWPAAIKSRLSEEGRLVLLTDQDEDYVAERLHSCGLRLGERHNFDPEISALVFLPVLDQDAAV